MPEYYENQVAREKVLREQERVDAEALVRRTAPEAEREKFLDALGLV